MELLKEMKKKKIGVLLGGLSEEREISLKTGNAVLGALRSKGYKAVAIDAGRDLAARLASERIEAAFMALHGRYGEDGCVQGLLEVMGIPYTGSGVRSSALCMDKVAAKKMMIFHGVSTPKFCVFREDERGVLAKLPKLPLVVKPVAEGSAIGVSIVRSKAALAAAVDSALRYGGAALAEEFIEGRELTVSILNGRVLPTIEIRPREGFYDFHAKYTKGATGFLVPAPLSALAGKRVAACGLGAYAALGCSGAARVDVMLDANSVPYALEVNTIPGLTELSLFPRAAAAAGLDYPALVEEMLLGAGLNKA
ncbi:MAG: D-alanine--D-alanine ligase [Deltaproteobacteria bacterium]|nr:D-alanine--D-alanine ligase [Deltaproteobacteria bacterium]